MLLSVIIPIYNAESYINRCVNSIVSQSFNNLQIILVDDGSIDSSLQLCNFWAEKDARIEVIHKENGGLSDARNIGITKAKGEYITFVDADDTVAQDTYQSVMQDMMPNIGILEYPVMRFYSSPIQERLSFTKQVYDNPQDYWIKGEGYTHSYACNKIFRREIFQNILFPVGKVFEDVIIMEHIVAHSNILKQWKIATTPHGLYFYYTNSNSITAQASGEQLYTLLSAHLNNPWLLTDDKYYLHVLNIQIDVFLKSQHPIELPYKRVKYTFQLSGKQLIKTIFTNLLGIKGLCKLYKIRQSICKHH